MSLSWLSNVAYTVGVAAGISLFVTGYCYARDSMRARRLPPGPPTRIFVGNNHQLQADPTPLFFKYHGYQKEYGDIISFKNGPLTTVVLQTGELVRETFDKKNAIYSQRPVSEFNRLLSDGNQMVFQRDHAIWRKSKRAIAQHFSPVHCESEFVGIQQAESVQLLWELASPWRKDKLRKRIALMQDTQTARAAAYRYARGLGWGCGYGVETPEYCGPYPRSISDWRQRVALGDTTMPLLTPDDSSDEKTEASMEDGTASADSFVRYTSSVLTSITYGFRAESYDSPACKGLEAAMNASSDIKRPGVIPPIDAYPFLNWLPDRFAEWRVRTKKAQRAMSDLYEHLYNRAVDWAVSTGHKDSFANRLSQTQESHTLTDRQVHFLCGVVLEGGTDVTAIAITSCIMALMDNPSLQTAAQEEIDIYCDEDHIPTWADKENLHYVTMLNKETLRWRPPFPLGVAHSLDADDICRGYELPKGTTVVANLWAIHQDPRRYPNPSVFDPERYRNDRASMSASMHKDADQRDHFAFGAGRRSCPGVQLAEQAMFLAIARILWAFTLSVPDGYELDTSQETAFIGNGVRRPKRFPIVATPRSQKRMVIVEREMKFVQNTVFKHFGTG